MKKLNLFDGLEPEFATTKQHVAPDADDREMDEFTRQLDLELMQCARFDLIGADGSLLFEATDRLFDDLDAGLE